MRVAVTSTTIQKELIAHPDYPSLLSMMEVIDNYGISSSGIKMPMKGFSQLTCPFIAQIKAPQTKLHLFAVVTQLNAASIVFFHPENNKIVELSLEQFSKIYAGTILVIEVNEHNGQSDFVKIRQQENQSNLYNSLSLFLLPIMSLIACLFAYITHHSQALVPILFTLFTLLGCIICLLLLWHEIDEYNPVVRQICHAGKKVNCSAILNSDAAKIWGLSWSILGSTYFIGMLLSVLVGGITNIDNLFLLSWINLMALPYIVYSISYQWLIAKQWCVLCLAVQVILFLQFVTAYFGGFHRLQLFVALPYSAYITIAVSYAMVFTVLLILIPALEKAKDSGYKTISLKRLQHNPIIFEALLAKQKSIQHSTEGLGITLGNRNAAYKLVKVCNPYCWPCAQAHPIMEALLANNENLQIQILFTATTEENDIKTPPVKHLLAIAAMGDEAMTRKALDDWYMAERKDYAAFAKKYPLNGELQEQDDKVKAMQDWCNKEEVRFTPYFFLNGYELPDIYSIKDLKYFLLV